MDFFTSNQNLRNKLKSHRFFSTGIDAELNKIAAVCNRKLPDAVAFYSGRIVEASSKDVVRRLGYAAGSAVVEHLDLINSSAKSDDGYIACGNVLRRIGNDARHLTRPILEDEEGTILGLLQLWVEWYLQFIGILNENECSTAVFSNWSSMTTTIRTLVNGTKEEMKSLVHSDGSIDLHLLADPTTAAFAGERFADAQLPIADRFTEKAAKLFSSNKRVQQVRAIFFSRNGQPRLAIKHLEKVRRWKNGEDGETLGILGGAHKNLWLINGDAGELENAYRCYTKKINGEASSYYRYINAAATALWQGLLPEARSNAFLAQECLKNVGVSEEWALSLETNYWVVATLAEATLIEGKYNKSCLLYEHAKKIDKTGGRWARTKEQLAIHSRFIPAIHEQFGHLLE